MLSETDKFGYAPLHYAAHYGALEIARYLKDEGADINKVTLTHKIMTYSNMTAMEIALEKQEYDLLAILLLEAGTHISPAENGKIHIIHVVARNGLLHHVQELIQHDPELLNVKDKFNQTPLLWAASRGHADVVAFLIHQGADIHAVTKLPFDFEHLEENNRSPLDWALVGEHATTIAILIQAGATANHSNNRMHAMPANALISEELTSLHDSPLSDVAIEKLMPTETITEIASTMESRIIDDDGSFTHKIDDQKSLGLLDLSIFYAGSLGAIAYIRPLRKLSSSQFHVVNSSNQIKSQTKTFSPVAIAI